MSQKNNYILFEMAAGYTLFLCKESAELEQLQSEVQLACRDFAKFSTMVKLISFVPFTSADEAVDNMNAIVKGDMTPFLEDFLTQQLPTSKKVQCQLGVTDVVLGQNINKQLDISCVHNETILELCRWIRFHIAHFLPDHKECDLTQAQLGLAHSYNRTLMRLNVNRSDNMIIQAVSLLDQMDKDVNKLTMRVTEWYSWHFPELRKLVQDNTQFNKLVNFIKNKKNLKEESIPSIAEIVGSEEKAQEIVATAAISMGMDLTEQDFLNIDTFATRLVSLSTFRTQLHAYLCEKMNVVAPNMSAVLGEQLGAQLIVRAGSLTNLAKYPSSTLQILGAEKALFRALKEKSNTPKYGLIFHSGYISKAKKEHKGKVARILANKASLCCRIDCFMENPNRVIGEELSKQVHERVASLESGAIPSNNQAIMEKAVNSYLVLQGE